MRHAVVPALLGVILGQRVRARLSEATFRTLLFSGLVALGVWIAAGSIV